MLDRLYQAFDALAEKHALFKVETIGKASALGLAYLCTGGSMAHLPLVCSAQTQCRPREDTSLSMARTSRFWCCKPFSHPLASCQGGFSPSGDSYMTVANLREPQPDHVIRIAHFAIDAVMAANLVPIKENDPSMG